MSTSTTTAGSKPGRYLPDRKILAAGVSGILTWLATLALSAAGLDIPQDYVGGLVLFAMSAVGYAVPPSAQDVLRRVDDQLKSTFASGPALRSAVGALLVLGLAFGGPVACGTVQVTRADGSTPAQTVYAIQSDYNAALSAAVEYVESGRASPEARKAIVRLDDVAYSAIAAAREAVRSGDPPTIPAAIAAARAAVAELVAYVARHAAGAST